MSSDAGSTPQSEPETTPEEYRQRALLFADLGRYDDAAEEIGAGLTTAPDDPALLAALARIHLAADQPTQALVAADRAVAAAPGTPGPLVVRAMALTDSRRFAEAAQVATDVLRGWPEDPYAQRTGAALLSESRNGQEALNAAWNGVRIAPEDGEAHLVLAVVAARLRLFDLAQRAYSEALDLDTTIGAAQQDSGIIRLERRRWATALEALADEAALAPAPPPEPVADPVPDPPTPPADRAPQAPPYPSPFPRPYPKPGTDDTAAVDGPPDVRPAPPEPKRPPRVEPPPISRPVRPVLDPSADSAEAIGRATLYLANSALVAAVLIAGMTVISTGASRVWAAMISVLILPAVLIWLARRLTEPTVTALARQRGARAVALYLAAAASPLILGYAVVGNLVPLIAAMGTAAAAEVLVLTRRSR